MKKIGKVTHYYDKIGVAVVDLEDNLTVGATIKISGHDNEFTQTVSSIQIEHQELNAGKKGQTIGLKIDQPVKEGDQIFLITE